METVQIKYNNKPLTVVGDYEKAEPEVNAAASFICVDAFVGDECVTFIVDRLDYQEIEKIEALCLEEIHGR